MPKADRQRRFRLTSMVWLLVMLFAVGLGVSMGLQSMRHELAAKLYQKQLHDLADDYDGLLQQYNQVVKQEAVTELVVANGNLTVSRVDRHGRQQTVPVQVNVKLPVYVDFIVQDDRLWLRSIYDASQSPMQAQMLDPGVWGVDWDAPGTQYGLVAYRQLDEGRWVVTASQNGGLRLTRVGDGQEVKLVPAPPVREFETIDRDIQKELKETSALNVLLGG